MATFDPPRGCDDTVVLAASAGFAPWSMVKRWRAGTDRIRSCRAYRGADRPSRRSIAPSRGAVGCMFRRAFRRSRQADAALAGAAYPTRSCPKLARALTRPNEGGASRWLARVPADQGLHARRLACHRPRSADPAAAPGDVESAMRNRRLGSGADPDAAASLALFPILPPAGRARASMARRVRLPGGAPEFEAE
jgi:hypothetical protein